MATNEQSDYQISSRCCLGLVMTTVMALLNAVHMREQNTLIIMHLDWDRIWWHVFASSEL